MGENLGRRAPGGLSEETALEVIAFYSRNSKGVRYHAGQDELSISGLGMKEQMLLTASLIALGAEKSAFQQTDTDDGVLVLGSARQVANRLSDSNIEFVGKADLSNSRARS